MTSYCLNIIGLSLDIVGVILLFFFGLPPSISRDGTNFIILEQKDEKEAKRAKIYDFLSRIALILLVVGFFLQIIANWIIVY